MTTFEYARNSWIRMGGLRSLRSRLKRFTYGRQWDDLTVDNEGKLITEGEAARRAGRRPLTNNLLRSLVKSVVGRFRHNIASASALSGKAAEIHRLNSLDELDARLLEEFLISGCAIQRVAWENRFDGHRVWIDNVSPSRFFCNRFLDPRGSDIRLVGMLHDMSAQEVRMRFAHRSHPFAVRFYPLTDGEVHPFIEDVIDQQLHINRLITTIDSILNNSAKGVLLFPIDACPQGVSISEAASLWHKPSAVIPINPRARMLPQEIVSSGRSEGASALLDIEFRLFQQISGVSGALQGQAPSGHVSASLYDAQVANSAVALQDIFSTFDTFRGERDVKALKSC